MTDSLETKVARAMVEPLGYPKDTDPARIWVGSNVDSSETGSLAYLCDNLARAAIATMLAEMRHPTQAMLDEGADECAYREDAHINAACCWTAMLGKFGGGK